MVVMNFGACGGLLWLWWIIVVVVDHCDCGGLL